jgi:aryl-alcohol dehydrogenase-like predicted oxidoreductase
MKEFHVPDLPYNRIGRSGLTVSAIGLGTNNLGMKLDADQSREVVFAALDEGITFFDTADGYGQSEERLGELLVGRRDDVVIASKFGADLKGAIGPDWGARGSRRYIVRAVENSLRRLRTDWIDLYQIHFPDPATPIEETLSALDDLVHAGKVRYLGHSNFSSWQTADAHWVAQTRDLTPFVSAQNRYNLLERDAENELLPALAHYGVGFLPYFPLASGLLTGKYRRGTPAPAGSRIDVWKREWLLTDNAFDVIERVEKFATNRGVSILDVAFGWLRTNPLVASVIAGATSREQVAANVRSVCWTPTAADRAELDDLTDRHSEPSK